MGVIRTISFNDVLRRKLTNCAQRGKLSERNTCCKMLLCGITIKEESFRDAIV